MSTLDHFIEWIVARRMDRFLAVGWVAVWGILAWWGVCFVLL